MADFAYITDPAYGSALANVNTPAQAMANRLAIQAALDASDSLQNPWTVIVPQGEFYVDQAPMFASLVAARNAHNVTLMLYGNIHNITNRQNNQSCALSMGSYNWQSADLIATYYNCSAGMKAGATSIALDSSPSGGLTALPAGTLAIIRSKSYVNYVAPGPTDVHISTYAGLVIVTGQDPSGSGTIFFEPPIDEDIAYALIAPAYHNIPVDGGNLYACYRCSVVGPGSLISDYWWPMIRGGHLECTIDVGELRGFGGFSGNLKCHGYYRVRNVRSSYEVQDVAMASNNSTFECETAYCDSMGKIGTTLNPGALLTIGNEHGRNLRFRYGTIIAPAYANGTGINFATGAHNCSFECNRYIAPLATGAAIEIENEIENVSGDQIQHTTSDNSVSFGEVNLGSGAHYVRISNGGNHSYRNKILRGHFSGAVSGDSMLIEGYDHFIGPGVRCDGPALPSYKLQALGIGTSAGMGYSSSPPDVITLAGGIFSTPAQVTVTGVNSMTGAITTFHVSSGGVYTTTSPTFTQATTPPPASGGTGATFATALFVQLGALLVNTQQLTSLQVDMQGMGYLVGDVITLSGGTGSSAATVIVTAVTGTNGVSSVQISGQGSYSNTSTTFTQALTPPPASGGMGATFKNATFGIMTTGLTLNGAYFAGDVTLGTGIFDVNNIRNLRSTSQAAMRSAYTVGNNLTAITTTTANSPIPGATCVIAANTLQPGDTVDFVIRGTVTNGTMPNNSKTIQIEVTTDMSTVSLGALVFSSSQTGAFKYVGQLVIETNNVYAAYVDAYINGTSTPTRARTTGRTIGANTFTLAPEAWVLGANDSITVDYFEIAPRRKTADVP